MIILPLWVIMYFLAFINEHERIIQTPWLFIDIMWLIMKLYMKFFRLNSHFIRWGNVEWLIFYISYEFYVIMARYAKWTRAILMAGIWRGSYWRVQWCSSVAKYLWNLFCITCERQINYVSCSVPYDILQEIPFAICWKQLVYNFIRNPLRKSIW